MIETNIKRLILAGLLALTFSPGALQSAAQPPGALSGQSAEKAATDRTRDDEFGLAASETAGTYVIEVDGREARCRAATEVEAHKLIDREARQPLKFIKGGEASEKAASAGLSIQLRGTTQLDAYPEAKAAFIRAAERWEAVIRDPISIIIDVDFGPTRFGTPYASPNLLGSTSSDLRQGTYSSLRAAMLAKFPSSELYLKLPTTVPTDHGSATTAVAPGASLRALGLLAAAQGASDPAPSIGFNSAQPFDFDPTNGVNAGEYDFDAVVTHEMGHALGFDSLVGDLELHPTNPLALSSLDLFRFRSGITLATFTTTQRVLSSGGDQFFFDGVTQVPMSTGRASDGSGGDTHQASHWKDINLLGSYIGIMVPVLPTGARGYMRSWDLDALSWLGYNIASASFNEAEIDSVSPTSVLPGGGEFTLAVAGANFASGATVMWGGAPRATTFVSVNQVTAAIAASDIASVGAASIEVVNPGAIPSNTKYVSIGSLSSSCTPATTSLCLNGGRFSVTATWRKTDGTSGQGRAIPLTNDTGYFWFFDSTNVEVITKVLNGCGLTNSYWVFASGLTNVEVTLTYTDTKTGTTRPYTNPLGSPFQPIQDTAAFSTCP